MALILKKWEYLSNKKVFYSKVSSIFIIYLDIAFVVFVYVLIN